MATENLTSLFVVVPKTSKSDWLGNYEKLSEFVVRCSFPACAAPFSGPLHTNWRRMHGTNAHVCDACKVAESGRRLVQWCRRWRETVPSRSKVGDSAF